MKDSDMDRFVILEALLSTRSNCKYYNVPEGALTLRWHARMYDAAVGLRIPQLLQSSSFRTPRQARIFGYEKPSKDHWESVLSKLLPYSSSPSLILIFTDSSEAIVNPGS